MMGDFEAGLIDGVVAYDLDRFARQPTDLERTIRLYNRRPGVFSTVQGHIDLGSADGRTLARVMVAFANKSNMDMSRRITRKKRQMAEHGIYGGGGKRAYGYDADRVTVRPDEAKIMQKAAQRVLAGESLTSICKSFNERGTDNQLHPVAAEHAERTVDHTTDCGTAGLSGGQSCSVTTAFRYGGKATKPTARFRLSSGAFIHSLASVNNA
jgi:DNA invertase Pin-like site-specific DNA recombinase